MTSWSNPNPSPTYAELMRGHTFSGGGAGHYNAAPNQWAQAGQQAISAVAQIMQEKKRQDIAQTLLDHASYDSNDGQGDPLAAKLNESSMAPADAWKAYQQQREMDAQQLNQSIKQQQLQKVTAALASKNQPPGAPVVDEPTGLVWNGRTWTHPVRGGGASGAQSSMLDRSLAPYGLTGDDLSGVDFTTPGAIQYVDTATGKQISTAAANMNPKGTNAVVSIAGKDSPTAIPYQKFLSVRQLYNNTSGGSSDALAPAAADSGLAAGSERTVNGKKYRWDGTGWTPIE